MNLTHQFFFYEKEVDARHWDPGKTVLVTAQEAEAAGYTLETDENGETVLTFYAKDGVISYKKVS